MIRDDDLDAAIDPDLLSILACPICPDRPPLSLMGHVLVCGKCHQAFPIREGIPQLTPEDAMPLSQIKDQLDD